MADPIHIVMTPVRNEAWVLKSFLEATSLWADYIIIADQMSTDGSREIVKEYSKAILIDNPSESFNEDGRQALLIAKAREIATGRDCLLWGLDADEILSANFRETKDWQKILNSKPGDVFWFKWAEICPDKKHYWISSKTYYPWMFHDDGQEPHKNYVRNMHSMRIPYPIEEKQMYYVDDFRVLHLNFLNLSRVESKRRFYSFVDWEMNHRNPITLSRTYYGNGKANEEVLMLPEEFLYTKERHGFDLFENIDMESACKWMDKYVLQHLKSYKPEEIRTLDIWDTSFSNMYGKDPRTTYNKILHTYLHITNKCRENILVRGIDKIIFILISRN